MREHFFQREPGNEAMAWGDVGSLVNTPGKALNTQHMYMYFVHDESHTTFLTTPLSFPFPRITAMGRIRQYLIDACHGEAVSLMRAARCVFVCVSAMHE